eukprot:c18126_g1_i1.p2 GENE.c18126_g1_i1~~c18126_g1_i1.p2  ORF type:complete len:109 (+),score=17.00 c18126_g1_i1:46-372(+)
MLSQVFQCGCLCICLKFVFLEKGKRRKISKREKEKPNFATKNNSSIHKSGKWVLSPQTLSDVPVVVLLPSLLLSFDTLLFCFLLQSPSACFEKHCDVVPFKQNAPKLV